MLNSDFPSCYKEFEKKYLCNRLSLNNLFEPSLADTKSINLIFTIHTIINKSLNDETDSEELKFFYTILYGLVFLETQNQANTIDYKSDLKKIFLISDSKDDSHVQDCLRNLDEFLSAQQIKTEGIDLNSVQKRIDNLFFNPKTPVIRPKMGDIKNFDFLL
jgi:hypothetical protein